MAIKIPLGNIVLNFQSTDLEMLDAVARSPEVINVSQMLVKVCEQLGTELRDAIENSSDNEYGKVKAIAARLGIMEDLIAFLDEGIGQSLQENRPDGVTDSDEEYDG